MRVDEAYLRVMATGQVAALELYPSESCTPARYRTFGDGCAMLLLKRGRLCASRATPARRHVRAGEQRSWRLFDQCFASDASLSTSP